MTKITVQQKFKQKPEQVFAAFAKHSIYNKAFWPLQVERIKDAAEPQKPDGVGSIREMGFGPVKPIKEQITALEPNQLIEYQLINNPLIKHHIGRLKFASIESGTLLTYEIELIAKLPLISLPALAGLKVALAIGLAKVARQL
ncbi:SRPBCC family protein [Alkanindiges sp. WGS2144]|uniref:SRPBCC family protein n=1 Tax=Alkanindiges sp. WGS2144 TaxID=3366808 RepID=UPI0037510F21